MPRRVARRGCLEWMWYLIRNPRDTSPSTSCRQVSTRWKSLPGCPVLCRQVIRPAVFRNPFDPAPLTVMP